MHIAAEHEAARHVLAVTGIAFDHHGRRLKHRHGDLCHGELLVVSLLRRDDGGVAGKKLDKSTIGLWFSPLHH